MQQFHHHSNLLFQLYFREADNNYSSLQLMPGSLELMEYLKSQNIPMTIATSSPQPSYDAKMAVHPRVKQLLSVAATTGDQVTNSKPHPEIFLTAASKLEVPAEQCVAFEDSPAGVVSAAASGARVVHIADGRFSHTADNEDKLKSATWKVKSPAEFLELMRAQMGAK